MMTPVRTTVNIDDELLETLKGRAHEEDLPFTQLLNRALRAGIEALERPPARRPRHREQAFAMGEPRFDLDRALALAAALEDEETVRKLRLRK
jgi:hypothetical protein